MDHSYATHQRCVKLDQAGIFILMWGACVPMIYYGFICNRQLQIFYWTTVSNDSLLSKTKTDCFARLAVLPCAVPYSP
jgi:adiponectin receptor